MSDELIARRALLKAAVAGAVTLPVLGLAGAASAADMVLVPLKADEPTAKALAYFEDSTKVDQKIFATHKPEQMCSACVQFKGKAGDARGGCNIFVGKTVNAHGWCKVFAAKPKV
jgi:hypothetical protein